MWMGDFNFEEPRGDTSTSGSGDGQQGARARMLGAYAAVCAKLGSRACGGLEDAYAITHVGRHGVTSKAGRAIDRILVDPRMVGGVPGIVDADLIHQTDLQVKGKNNTLRAAPDHKAPRVTLRLSDIEKPPPRTPLTTHARPLVW